MEKTASFIHNDKPMQNEINRITRIFKEMSKLYKNYILQKTIIYLHARTKQRKENPQQTSML